LARRLGGLPLLRWTTDTLWLVLAALVAGAVAWALAHGVQWPSGLVGLLLRPTLSGLLGLAAYGVVVTWAGVPEAQQLLGGLQRRLPFRTGP
jgi:peptidoglycan biosynthesis protein MviN/MurJ (putative lipid II flippase)